MRCVFAIKSLEASRAGAERVFVDVVNGLLARRHHVTVVSYDRTDAKSCYALDSRVEWIRLGLGRVDRPSTPWETAVRMRALRRILPGFGADAVVAFMHSMFVPLGMAMVGTGIPVVASEHAVPDHYLGRWLEHTLLRLTPWLVHRIVVVSEQVKARYPASWQSRMVVIPNPVRPMSIVLADAVGASGQRRTLLSVGRLAEQKDYPTLIDAFALIADRLPDWDLRIVGDGECRAALWARIEAYGLEGRISLPGVIEDIGSEYSRAQLFVIPSLYESHGLVVVEALAHGLPAVGFANCLGVNRLIRPGRNGELVAGPDRVQSLAEVLVRLMGDSEARARLAPSEANLPDVHDPERILDRWECLLNESRRTRTARSSLRPQPPTR